MLRNNKKLVWKVEVWKYHGVRERVGVLHLLVVVFNGAQMIKTETVLL